MLRRVFAVVGALQLTACVASGWTFGPGFSLNGSHFAEPPVVVCRGTACSLTWTQGDDPFFFRPSYATREGKLIFALVATTSSGNLAGRRQEMEIVGPENLRALRASGAFWWESEPEPNGRLVRLRVIDTSPVPSSPERDDDAHALEKREEAGIEGSPTDIAIAAAVPPPPTEAVTTVEPVLERVCPASGVMQIWPPPSHPPPPRELVVPHVPRNHFRPCYAMAERDHPSLVGSELKFEYLRSGSVREVCKPNAKHAGRELSACFVNSMQTFPRPDPESGVVTITFPLRPR